MDPGKAAMEEWTNLVWGPHRTERCGVQNLLSLSVLSSMKGTREIRLVPVRGTGSLSQTWETSKQDCL